MELTTILAIAKGLLTGMAFGFILYKVGAVRYSRVMGMLTLRDTKIMKFAFTSIATSSLLYGLASIFGISEQWNLNPRIMPFFGSAHLLGGVIFGAALGWIGACPGSCVAKTGGKCGDKKFVGISSIFGLIGGVLLYTFLKEPLINAEIINSIQKPMTLHGLLGVSYGTLALIWANLFFALALLVNRLTNEKPYQGEWGWLTSGILAGIIVVTATAQNGYLGFSGSLLALVGWGAYLLGHPLDLVPIINNDIAWRAMLIIGVLLGGFLAAKFFSNPSHKTIKEFDLNSILKSFIGGLGLSLGAMIGGGCTTGAFIAAWPTLSVGSLAMGGTFFAASMATSNLLILVKKFNLEQAQTLGEQVYD